MSIFISHHAETNSDVAHLTGALHAKGLLCTANATKAGTILLYISPAYIAPHSPTIAEAGRFLNQESKLVNVIAIFARISVPEVKHQAEAPGWDDLGILRKLVSNMGIDMKYRNLDIDRVASIVLNRSTMRGSFDIFLSHAGEDKKFVRVLKEVFEPRYQCFLDEESLSPGNQMGMSGDKQLIAAAKTARLGLFVLSDYSIKKKWPLKEVSIFQEEGIPIVVVWYRFLTEQAEQYVRNPPQDLLLHPEASDFLRTVLCNPSKSIWYPGAAWNNPNSEEYALFIKGKIDEAMN
eukprot:c22552_g1_i1 orf=305-1180(-)